MNKLVLKPKTHYGIAIVDREYKLFGYLYSIEFSRNNNQSLSVDIHKEQTYEVNCHEGKTELKNCQISLINKIISPIKSNQNYNNILFCYRRSEIISSQKDTLIARDLLRNQLEDILQLYNDKIKFKLYYTSSYVLNPISRFFGVNFRPKPISLDSNSIFYISKEIFYIGYLVESNGSTNNNNPHNQKYILDSKLYNIFIMQPYCNSYQTILILIHIFLLKETKDNDPKSILPIKSPCLHNSESVKIDISYYNEECYTKQDLTYLVELGKTFFQSDYNYEKCFELLQTAVVKLSSCTKYSGCSLWNVNNEYFTPIKNTFNSYGMFRKYFGLNKLKSTEILETTKTICFTDKIYSSKNILLTNQCFIMMTIYTVVIKLERLINQEILIDSSESATSLISFNVQMYLDPRIDGQHDSAIYEPEIDISKIIKTKHISISVSAYYSYVPIVFYVLYLTIIITINLISILLIILLCVLITHYDKNRNI